MLGRNRLHSRSATGTAAGAGPAATSTLVRGGPLGVVWKLPWGTLQTRPAACQGMHPGCERRSFPPGTLPAPDSAPAGRYLRGRYTVATLSPPGVRAAWTRHVQPRPAEIQIPARNSRLPRLWRTAPRIDAAHPGPPTPAAGRCRRRNRTAAPAFGCRRPRAVAGHTRS